MNGPPANHAELASFECTESTAWPVIDAIWAGLNGLGAISAASDNKNPDQGQIVAVGIGWLAVSGIAAISGFRKVSQCVDAKRLRDERYYPSRVAGPARAPAVMPTVPAASGVAPPPAAPVPPDASVSPPPAAAPPPAGSRDEPVAPASASPPATTSPSASSLRVRVHPAQRSVPPRSLAMRPTLAVD